MIGCHNQTLARANMCFQMTVDGLKTITCYCIQNMCNKVSKLDALVSSLLPSRKDQSLLSRRPGPPKKILHCWRTFSGGRKFEIECPDKSTSCSIEKLYTDSVSSNELGTLLVVKLISSYSSYNH